MQNLAKKPGKRIVKICKQNLPPSLGSPVPMSYRHRCVPGCLPAHVSETLVHKNQQIGLFRVAQVWFKVIPPGWPRQDYKTQCLCIQKFNLFSRKAHPPGGASIFYPFQFKQPFFESVKANFVSLVPRSALTDSSGCLRHYRGGRLAAMAVPPTMNFFFVGERLTAMQVWGQSRSKHEK